MKKADVYNYLESLESIKELQGAKFSYAVLKNKKKLQEEKELLENLAKEVTKPNDKYMEYENKRMELCTVHSEKDENGQAITENNAFKIKKDSFVDFNTELTKLRNKYTKELEERQKQLDDYNKLMLDEIELDFVKVKFEELPVNITPQQLEGVDFMIDLS